MRRAAPLPSSRIRSLQKSDDVPIIMDDDEPGDEVPIDIDGIALEAPATEASAAAAQLASAAAASAVAGTKRKSGTTGNLDTMRG